MTEQRDPDGADLAGGRHRVDPWRPPAAGSAGPEPVTEPRGHPAVGSPNGEPTAADLRAEYRRLIAAGVSPALLLPPPGAVVVIDPPPDVSRTVDRKVIASGLAAAAAVGLGAIVSQVLADAELLGALDPWARFLIVGVLAPVAAAAAGYLRSSNRVP